MQELLSMLETTVWDQPVGVNSTTFDLGVTHEERTKLDPVTDYQEISLQVSEHQQR